GGDAARAIDGNKSGNYGDGGQTHSHEATADPWWEVDLGGEVPIETIALFNCTDRKLGTRVNDFTRRGLHGKPPVAFRKTKQPAPKECARFEVGGESPQHAIRRAAMNALNSVRGKEEQAFKAIAPFVGDNFDRHAAEQALLRIPVGYWPKEDAKPLLDKLL